MTDPVISDRARLWIVATPLGNLGDLGSRVVAVLSGVDVIAAEDTRYTARLLTHAGVDTPLCSLHEHNEQARAQELLGRLAQGQSVALVSDAGTPLISDPGYVLVRDAREQGMEINCVPGPCAAVAALSVAGLPTDRFVFEGFLPAKSSGRKARLEALAGETRTLVFYESSHRIQVMVRDLASVFGADRQVTLARELTKLHEQSVACRAGELVDWLNADDNRRRGEFVLVVAGAEKVESAGHAAVELDALLRELLAVAGTRDAVKAAVRLTGLPRNQVYTRAVALK